MSVTIRSTGRYAIVGDSLTKADPGNGVSWYVPLVQAANTFYSSASRPSSATTAMPNGWPASVTSWNSGPTFANFGVAGDTAASIAARLAPIYAYRPTGVIIECGINDVTNGTAQATFEANVTLVVNGLKTQANYPAGVSLPEWIMWVGPLCGGELLWGTNPWDTFPGLAADADHTLVQKDASLRTLSASLGFELVQFRTNSNGDGVWKTYELANNVGNAGSGILTLDGRHLIAAGATLMSNTVLAQMTFA